MSEKQKTSMLLGALKAAHAFLDMQDCLRNLTPDELHLFLRIDSTLKAVKG